jgi:ERCC4-type nuclease
MASLVVDGRESALLAALADRGVDAERAGLPCGDAVVGDRVIVERKTLRDMAASIKDGRWHDQLERMRESGLGVVLMLEDAGWRWGDAAETDCDTAETVDGVPRSTLRSAALGAILRHGASLVVTRGVEESAAFLAAAADKASRLGTAESGAPRGMLCRSHAAATPRGALLALLAGVPGVSPQAATDVVRATAGGDGGGEAGASVWAWMTWASGLPRAELVRRLADVRRSSGGRRLGGIVGGRIAEVLFGADVDGGGVGSPVAAATAAKARRVKRQVARAVSFPPELDVRGGVNEAR